MTRRQFFPALLRSTSPTEKKKPLADILAKQFALLGFVAANSAWLFSLRSGAELGKGAVLFSVLSGIGAVAIGVLVYHEKTTPRQVIGLALGIAAIAFLSIE